MHVVLQAVCVSCALHSNLVVSNCIQYKLGTLVRQIMWASIVGWYYFVIFCVNSRNVYFDVKLKRILIIFSRIYIFWLELSPCLKIIDTPISLFRAYIVKENCLALCLSFEILRCWIMFYIIRTKNYCCIHF